MGKKESKNKQPPLDFTLLPLPDLEKDAEVENKKAIREIISWVALFVTAIVAAGLLLHYIAAPIRVDGTSMIHTLDNNEFILVSKVAYLARDPQRLDIVICRYPGRDGTYVKRIVGIPGDTVQIQNHTVYINGQPLDEPYIDYPADYTYPLIQLGQDQYFVLGDNRIHSTDSHVIGPITRDAIEGYVHMVVYPFDQVRSIYTEQ